MELPNKPPAVPYRCMVRSGTAEAGAQRAKPAKEQKVSGGCRPASRRATVELKVGRRADGVVHQEQTPLEHRQRVHRSAEALRARRVLLCRRSFKPDPDAHDGGEQNSGARRWNRMGQKDFQHMLGTFITSDQTTRALDQRVGRDGGGARPVEIGKAASRRALCLVSAFECSRPNI